jgi:hypothetical protein
MEMDSREMAASRRLEIAALLAVLCLCGVSHAQSTGQTVRHHKVAEEDSSFPPELLQAEAAIEKKDYTSAEPLLRKVVAAMKGSFRCPGKQRSLIFAFVSPAVKC